MRSGRRVELPVPYMDTRERRVLDFTPEGIPCIPLFGLCNYKSVMAETVEHVHKGCIEITYCLRGALAFESMGKNYPFLPGSLFVSKPDQPHHLVANSKGLLTYWLLFRIPEGDEGLLSLPPEECDWLRESLLAFPVRICHGGKYVRQCFEKVFQLYDTLPRESLQRRLHLRTAVLSLLLAVLRAPYASVTSIPPVKRLEGVIENIRLHPERDYSIAKLSAEAGFSQTSFNMAFKQITGLPPHAFLLSQRIEAGKRLLRSTDYSIQKIALALRFASAQHFAMQFRRETGTTPTDFRAQGGRA